MKPPDGRQMTDQVVPAQGATVSNHAYAVVLWICSVLLFWPPLRDLANLSFHDENSAHIFFIPLVSLFIIWLERQRIFRSTGYSPGIGVPLLLVTVALRYGLYVFLPSLNTTDRLSIFAAVIVLTWIAIFILCYGTRSFHAALFPLLYTGLMIPVPVVVIGNLISFLQKASADTSYVLFRLMGVPVFRHGFTFSLPRIDVEVARECSGIHAALSLLIAGLLAAYFVLPNAWKRVWFVLCIFPIAIFKNAVRIVTLAWIGVYINPAIFQSKLHRYGGLPFSVVALVLMAALLWLLRRPFLFAPGRVMRHDSVRDAHVSTVRLASASKEYGGTSLPPSYQSKSQPN